MEAEEGSKMRLDKGMIQHWWGRMDWCDQRGPESLLVVNSL